MKEDKSLFKSVAEIPGIDRECIGICDTLNSLPGLRTTESCCGHFRQPFMVCFECDDFSTLGVLARVTSRNYSDGKWIVRLENGDMRPLHGFALVSREPFSSLAEMEKSVAGLQCGIRHWMSPEFDGYFERS